MENENGIEKLVAIMQSMNQAMQSVTKTLEKMEAEQTRMSTEQERMGKAIGEAGAVLQDHAHVIRNLGSAVVRLWTEAGLPITEAPQVPSGPVN